MKKVGRNDTCPCGSGKKYKHCCMGNKKFDNKAITTDNFGGKDPKHLSGINIEQEIQEVLRMGMLSDFVFENPKKDGKERCDVIILFDTTIVIFQIKSTSKPEKHSQKIIDEGIKQLNGAYRFIKRGGLTELENERQGKINLKIEQIKHVLGIVVPSAGDCEYYGSTLRTNRNGCFVHLIDDVNLKEIIKNLDTPPDFIEYLIKREKFLTDYPNVLASELDLLGIFISYGHSFRLPNGPKPPDKIYLTGFWIDESENIKKIIEERDENNKISYFYDYILDQVHLSEEPDYIKGATEMSKFNRLERRAIGQKIYDLWRSSININNDTSGGVNFRNTDTVFYILFSKLGPYKRQDKLIYLASKAKYKLKAKKVIGIATEIQLNNPLSKPYSFNFFVLESSWKYDKLLESHEDTLKIKENIDLSDF